jgi:hypothetical protein
MLRADRVAFAALGWTRTVGDLERLVGDVVLRRRQGARSVTFELREIVRLLCGHGPILRYGGVRAQ